MSRICGVVAVAGLVGLGAGCGPASPIDVETIPRSPDERPVLDFAHRLDLARVEVDRSVYRFDRATAPDHLGQGWSDPENPRGVPFAWAMSEQADVKLHVLDRTAGWLHFRAQPFGIGNATQAARIHLNGVDVGNVPLEGAGVQAYTLRLPPGALRTGENIVSFEFSYAVSPRSLNAAALDQRPLAAMFEHIEISASAEPVVEPTRPDSAGRASPKLDAALDLSGTSQAIFDLTVPVDGRLEFGHRGTTSRSSAQRTEVALRMNDGTEHVFFSAPPAAEPTTWMADLSAFQGQLAQLVFRVVGGDADQLPVSWMPPRLYGTTGEMDVETNVVLIVIDTLRADVLGSYGGTGGHTPYMDELAASGVTFERAYSHIPITVPSHSSMFTSLLPTEHAALNNGYVLNASHVTLAERLRDDTYRRTSAFVSLGVLKAHFGVAQGFDEYSDTFGRDWWKTAEEINAAVVPWVAGRSPAEPFFLWAHYSDPHEPYSAPDRDYPEMVVRTEEGTETTVIANGSTWRIPLDPGTDAAHVTVTSPGRLEWPIRLNGLRASTGATVTCGQGCRERSPAPGVVEYAVRLPASFDVEGPDEGSGPGWIQFRAVEDLPPSEIRVRYLEEVEYVDRAIGDLLAALRAQGDNPLVILTADHGEELGEHGGAGHVTRLYDTTLRVPLIFSWPGVLPEGLVVKEAVSHIDLLPTVFDLLGIADTEPRSGRSLSPQLFARPADVEPRPIVAETFKPEARKNRQALISGTHKLIATPEDEREELYDLEADPWEQHDLAPEQPDLTHQLSRLLRQRLTRARQQGGTPEALPIDEEELEKFRALGYIR